MKNAGPQTPKAPPDIENISHLDEQTLGKLIDYCKQNDFYAPLIRNLGRYFTSREQLVQCFQKLPATHIDELLQKAPKDLKKLKKEDFRTLEGDLDKDEDSCCTNEEKEKDRNLPPHYTSVDLVSLRRAMIKLMETNSNVFDSLNMHFHALALNIGIDLRFMTQRDKIEEIITVFVIIFEIIIIGKTDFVEMALPSICKAASYLPVWGQARLACIWAEHCGDGLRKLLENLQQMISLQVIAGAYHETGLVQDNEIIVTATKVMKIVYFASLLAGQWETGKSRDEDPESDTPIGDDESLFGYTGIKKSLRNSEFDDPLATELAINVLDCRRPLIPMEEFYNEPLSDAIEMDKDYLFYNNRQNGRDPSGKSRAT